MRGAEPARDSKAVVVEIDHDDASRRIELRGEQGRKTDRTCAHDRHAASRRDLPVENPAFIAGGQDVAEHDERFLVRSGGYRMEAVVGMRNADEFRLRSEEHTSELQSLMRISYAVFFLKKKRIKVKENLHKYEQC